MRIPGDIPRRIFRKRWINETKETITQFNMAPTAAVQLTTSKQLHILHSVSLLDTNRRIKERLHGTSCRVNKRLQATINRIKERKKEKT
jgi:hypothetical protein